jgi:hypothetical protein
LRRLFSGKRFSSGKKTDKGQWRMPVLRAVLAAAIAGYGWRGYGYGRWCGRRVGGGCALAGAALA